MHHAVRLLHHAVNTKEFEHTYLTNGTRVNIIIATKMGRFPWLSKWNVLAELSVFCSPGKLLLVGKLFLFPLQNNYSVRICLEGKPCKKSVECRVLMFINCPP